MIDTHSHIYSAEFDADRTAVVAAAQAAGVEHIVLANEDLGSIERLHQTHDAFPDFCSMAMGLHPESVGADFRNTLQQIGDELARGNYCAIGEIGLDLYWDTTYSAEQRQALEQQLDWALTFDLPVILHVRKAFPEMFASLAKFKNKPLRGVFHCFGGGVEEARKAVSLGFVLGVGGVFTYKNSGLPDILRPIGLQHLVLETDAPFLAPVPHRGRRNEPQFMAAVARKMAEIFDTSIEKIDEITTKNAENLFMFSQIK